MKRPGIFELTRREQRAVVLIMIALLAVAVVKRYRDGNAQSASPSQGQIAESEAP
jgi:hypothetical protein